MNIKFSVIIPLYNSKKTIRNTVLSAVSQTYKDQIEIIIINDGSTDGSEEIVNEVIYENKTTRIVKLINKKNGGVSSARNLGIKEARGEYIAFLDSDDMWHPQKLEIVYEVFKSNELSFLGHSHALELNFNNSFKPDQPKRVGFIRLLLKNFAVTPSIVIKKDDCDLFDESMSHTEDHELWLRMALKTNVYYLDLPLVVIRSPQLSFGGLSSDKWAMRKGELQMYKKITQFKHSLILVYPFLVLYSLLKHLIKACLAKS